MSSTRAVALAGSGYLATFIAASLLTGQSNVWLGNLAQLLPPFAYAFFTRWVVTRSPGRAGRRCGRITTSAPAALVVDDEDSNAALVRGA